MIYYEIQGADGDNPSALFFLNNFKISVDIARITCYVYINK